MLAGGASAGRIARWNGSTWSSLGSGIGMTYYTPTVLSLTAFDPGTGPRLVAGGHFGLAGGLPVNSMAKWHGASWSPVSWNPIVNGPDRPVNALTVFDFGNGPELVAGGDFYRIGHAYFSEVARWNGSAWSSIGNAFDTICSAHVSAFAVFDSV